MKTKKTTMNMSNETEDPIKFCKECEDKGLVEFGLDPNKEVYKNARDQHEVCKEVGRFNGDVCSRVFISSDGEEDFFLHDDEDDDELD